MEIDEVRREHFPADLVGEVVVRSVEPETAWAVAGELAEQVFTRLTELGLVAADPPASVLDQAFTRHQEHFVFFSASGDPVGWSIGHQIEPDTFFMLWTGILPSHQDQGIYSAFVPRLIAYCTELGYARITSNHMVNNTRVIAAKMRLGFIATALELDERWGAMLRLAYYVDAHRQRGFERAFSLERYD